MKQKCPYCKSRMIEVCSCGAVLCKSPGCMRIWWDTKTKKDNLQLKGGVKKHA